MVWLGEWMQISFKESEKNFNQENRNSHRNSDDISFCFSSVRVAQSQRGRADAMCGRFANGLTLQEYTDAAQQLLDVEVVVDPALQPDTQAEDSQQSGTQAGHESGAAPSSSQGSASQSYAPLTRYRPSYNVAPQTHSPVIRNARLLPREHATSSHTSETGSQRKQAKIQPMKWGLIPKWAKSVPTGADAYKTINARDDTALSGQSMWTPLLSEQRCVVLVQGFYEWQKTSGGRIAHFVGMERDGKGRIDAKGRHKALMPIAGFWEKANIKEPVPQELYSFTILTTHSNKQLNFLHDRMPVILSDKHAIAFWLGLEGEQGWNSDVAKLVKPYEGPLECFKCPTEVGKVGNNSSSFIQPIENRKDGIMAAFSRQAHSTTQTQKSKLNADDEISTNSESNAPRPGVKMVSKKREMQEEEGKGDEVVEAEPPPTKKQKVLPSSRFSPDPFNPPVSPPRPQGGYSREGTVASPRDQNKQQIKSLEVQAKAARSSTPKAKPAASSPPSKKSGAEGGTDIRNFFGKKT